MQFPIWPPFNADFALTASSNLIKFTNAHSRSGIIRIESIGPKGQNMVNKSFWGIEESRFPTHNERVGEESVSKGVGLKVYML